MRLDPTDRRTYVTAQRRIEEQSSAPKFVMDLSLTDKAHVPIVDHRGRTRNADLPPAIELSHQTAVKADIRKRYHVVRERCYTSLEDLVKCHRGIHPDLAEDEELHITFSLDGVQVAKQGN